MFKIDRARPWPPELDLRSLRAAVERLRQTARHLPQLADVERALAAVLAEIDEVEAVEESARANRLFLPPY